jgi:hypothetical protein
VNLNFLSLRPTETLAFLLTGNLKSSTTPSAARWAHPASNTSIITMEGGLCVAVARRRSVPCPRVDGSLEKGREGGLIEFEVGA